MTEQEKIEVEIKEPTEETPEQVEVEVTVTDDAITRPEDKFKPGRTTKQALQGRGNVVMVRVNDEALAHLDMLVEAEITKSRSESAAFLISEGIKANQALFDKIRAITEQIMELREQLRREVALTADEDEDNAEEDTPSPVD